ncbi:MAG: helicase-related protein, partial [Planctomycetia bacterium]
LVRVIDFHDVKSGVIFCNTQRMVDELADALVGRGSSAERIHGGMAQAQRTRVMQNFKRAAFAFLIATDVAARGIDVNDLELVVNYDLTYDAEDNVHRIGRTGPASGGPTAATGRKESTTATGWNGGLAPGGSGPRNSRRNTAARRSSAP